jgi:large subunit ribosomal protein L21
MYAVIATGGKQQRVAEGQRVNVELLGNEDGTEVSFTPILVVDGESVRATPAELTSAKVTATVIGTAKGPKINGFTYKSKANERKRWGHRQKYSTIEINKISV